MYIIHPACHEIAYHEHISIFEGDQTGNCGWNPQDLNDGDGNLQKNFNFCNDSKDLICGALHCHYDNYDSSTSIRNLKIKNHRLDGVNFGTDGENLCAVTSFDVGKHYITFTLLCNQPKSK